MKLTLLTSATLLTLINLPSTVLAENPAHISQVLSTKQCEQCELASAGLVMAELSGARLAGSDLTRANLSRANLTGADLRGAKLSGASLYGANLIGADLTGADLTGVDLRGAYLYNVKIAGVDLSSAYLEGAVGIPNKAGSAADFYRWATAEGQKGNYEAAIERYNQALALKPQLAGAYLGRGLAKYRLADEPGAIQDAKIAGRIFKEQKNEAGDRASQDFIKAIELAKQPPKEEKKGRGFLETIGGIATMLLQFLL